MRALTSTALCLGAVAMVSLLSVASAQETTAPPLGETLRDLDVLLGLYKLNLSPEQYQPFQAAVDAFLEARGRIELGARATEAAQKVRQIREALLTGTDAQAVANAFEGLANLREAGQPLPKKMEQAVREAVDPVLDALTPEQMATLAPPPGPAELQGLLKELTVVRQEAPDKWEAWRDDVSARIAYDVVGGNKQLAGAAAADIAGFLDEANTLTDQQIKQQHSQLMERLVATVTSHAEQATPTAQWQRDRAAGALLRLMDYPKFRILLAEMIQARPGA